MAVSSNLGMAMASLTVLSAVGAAAVALVSTAHLLRRWDRGMPLWVQACRERMVRVPLWALVLPVALSASYVAARIGLSPDPNANYWSALGLWLGAMILALVAFVPGLGPGMPGLDSLRLREWRTLRSEFAVIALVAVIALTLRVVKLNAAPFLTSVDEEAIRPDIVAGSIKNIFATGWSSVPDTYFFTVAGAFKVFGTGVVAVRMVSALVGAAAVVMTYLLLREMFGRWQGLIGALFMAGYHFHLHFSRVGLINGWDTLAAAFALYFAYRASRDQRTFDFAALGLVCGLTLYAYISASAVPLIVIAYLIYVSIFQRGFVRNNFGKLSLIVATFGLAAMPMGAFYLTHPDALTAGPSSRLLFHSAWYEQQLELGRSSISILWEQALHAFGGFVYYPTSPSGANLYDTPLPLIPGLAAVPFMAGFVYSVLHIEKKEYALLLLGLVVPTVLGGVLTYPPIQWQRFLGAIPAVSGLVAVGLWQLADRLLFWKRSAVPVLALLAVAFLAAQNIHLYFDAATEDITFGAPIRYVTVRYVRTLPEDTRIYWFGAPEVGAGFVGLSLHDRPLTEVFDAHANSIPSVEKPSPSAYLFTPGREEELPLLRANCPNGVTSTLSFRESKELIVYEMLQPNTCVPLLQPPPPNDSYTNATVVAALPFSATISTKAATMDPGEPQPGPAQPGNLRPCGGVANSAWYSFMAGTDTAVIAQTVGSSADTLVAVYEGNELPSLTPVACSSSQLDDHRARIEFTALAGVPYHFQVAALSYHIGTVTFSLAESSAQPASQN